MSVLVVLERLPYVVSDSKSCSAGEVLERAGPAQHPHNPG